MLADLSIITGDFNTLKPHLLEGWRDEDEPFMLGTLKDFMEFGFSSNPCSRESGLESVFSKDSFEDEEWRQVRRNIMALKGRLEGMKDEGEGEGEEHWPQSQEKVEDWLEQQQDADMTDP